MNYLGIWEFSGFRIRYFHIYGVFTGFIVLCSYVISLSQDMVGFLSPLHQHLLFLQDSSNQSKRLVLQKSLKDKKVRLNEKEINLEK